MNELSQSPVSLIHLSFALLALPAGTLVLFLPKGTLLHKRVGYVYVLCMLVVLITAFGIHRLFGRYGIVHWGALGTWLSLATGIGVVWCRRYVRNWLQWHYVGMNFSVICLYATFTVESTYRLFPPAFFWWTTVGTALVVLGIGSFLIYRQFRKYNPASQPRYYTEQFINYDHTSPDPTH